MCMPRRGGICSTNAMRDCNWGLPASSLATASEASPLSSSAPSSALPASCMKI